MPTRIQRGRGFADGGGGADGGGTGGSPGSVTLRLVIPSSHSFCDQATGCETGAHITILDATGHAVAITAPSCSTFCSAACTPLPCPGIACIPQGFPVKTSEISWDGSSYRSSTCGGGTACFQPQVSPAGHYVARMCATPGTITTADGGIPSTCTATGPIECVDVPFDLPGRSPIVGTLP